MIRQTISHEFRSMQTEVVHKIFNGYFLFAAKQNLVSLKNINPSDPLRYNYKASTVTESSQLVFSGIIFIDAWQIFHVRPHQQTVCGRTHNKDNTFAVDRSYFTGCATKTSIMVTDVVRRLFEHMADFQVDILHPRAFSPFVHSKNDIKTMLFRM